ncbi:MAG: NADP-dependent glyceraldehyde-3-phosphate dehydrogenase [bacterium]
MDVKQRIEAIFPEEKDIAKEYVRNLPVNQREYLVDGELRSWDGPMRDVFSPVCVKTASGISPLPLGSYPLMTEKESQEALRAAVAAYDNGRGEWPTMSVAGRIERVEDFLRGMKETKTDVVNMLMLETGKSLQDSGKEFDRTIEYVRKTIDSLKELDRISSRFTMEEGVIAQIRRAPLGVALSMGPYNYPLNETFTTLIPLLIMGNTAILKPPKFGVLLYSPLLIIFRDSFPRGVINTLYGDGETVIPPLMKSGKIDVLAFIGSSRVADVLKKQHPAPHRMRSVLGLDAKNAGIILPDADLDLAVKECALGSLSFNGQRCTGLKILFAHRKIADAFLEKFSAAVGALKFGMPWNKDVFLTPLPEPGKTGYLAGLVEDAKRFRASIANEAGGIINGTFFNPAVLYPVTQEMRVYSEEQFGPVVPIVPFDDMEEPTEYIINSSYGQQVSIFGNDPDVIAGMIDPLVNQVCRVNINSQCQRGPDVFPFTGRKDSAEGTLSVSDALRVFSIRTLVAAKDADINKEILSRITREHKSKFLSTDYIF